MLNMGFAEDIEKIMKKIQIVVKLPPQFILFSATIPDWVQDVATKYLNKQYKTIDLCKDLTNKTSKTVHHLAMRVEQYNRIATLIDVLQSYGGTKGKCIVFCATKADCNLIAFNEKVKRFCGVIHGDIS